MVDCVPWLAQHPMDDSWVGGKGQRPSGQLEVAVDDTSSYITYADPLLGSNTPLMIYHHQEEHQG